MATWLDLDSLADYIRIPKSTLYRMAQRGSLPGHKVGRTWRFDQDEVDDWIKAGGSKPGSASSGKPQRNDSAKPETAS
jgi:excisionase family DNA binding protein